MNQSGKHSTLTSKQQELIDFCKARGRGWSKFASNVEAQGWCSPKQHATLQEMKIRIQWVEERKIIDVGLYDRDTCINAEEIMSFHLEI